MWFAKRSLAARSVLHDVGQIVPLDDHHVVEPLGGRDPPPAPFREGERGRSSCVERGVGAVGLAEQRGRGQAQGGRGVGEGRKREVAEGALAGDEARDGVGDVALRIEEGELPAGVIAEAGVGGEGEGVAAAVHAPVGGSRTDDDLPGLLVDARFLLDGGEPALARLHLKPPVLDLLRGQRAHAASALKPFGG